MKFAALFQHHIEEALHLTYEDSALPLTCDQLLQLIGIVVAIDIDCWTSAAVLRQDNSRFASTEIKCLLQKNSNPENATKILYFELSVRARLTGGSSGSSVGRVLQRWQMQVPVHTGQTQLSLVWQASPQDGPCNLR